jgi:hypothetical protein
MNKLQDLFDLSIKIAKENGYNIGKVEIKARPINGRKVAYATGYHKGTQINGTIVIDSRFCESGLTDEILNTVKHELAHLIAETLNTKKKNIWHGDAWKTVHKALGGNGDRYYKGTFVKPENKDKVFKTMEQLRATKATEPANTWEHGTYRQWLERGYHVIKGQKGNLQVWKFIGNEYEMEDGKTVNLGTAYAVYFNNDQVEAN